MKFCVNVVALLGASVMWLGTATQARAQEACSAATLRGDYLAYGSAEARLDQQGVSSFPRVQIEIWTFDGVGSLSGVLTVNSGGKVMVDVPTSGTYTVNPDLCAALVTFKSGAQWEVFITRDGTEGASIRVDAEQNGETIIASRYLKKRSRREHDDQP